MKLSNMSMEYLKGNMSESGFKVLESYLEENKNLKDLKLLHSWNINKAEADVLFGNDIERVKIVMLFEGFRMRETVVDYQIVCDSFEVVPEKEKEWYLINSILKMNGVIDVYSISNGVAGIRQNHPNVTYSKLEKELKEFGYAITSHERGFDKVIRI